jgi:F0F1-type ATP synthase membrane subunit c/vacuolar-type H+-ATPase subunit K
VAPAGLGNECRDFRVCSAVTVDPQQRKVARVRALLIWGSLLSAQVLFVVLLLSGIVPAGRSQPGHLVTVLAVVALGAGIGDPMWRRARAPLDRVMRQTPDPATLLPLYIVAWALDETIAIFGLVLGLLGFPPAVWGSFSTAGLILTLIHRPA